MAPSGFHRWGEYGPRCWRGRQAAARERPQGPGNPGFGRFGDGQRPGRPARDEPQVRLPADAQGRTALDDAFSPTTPDEAVLFELAVTKTWLRQVIIGLTLICRSSYRGVMEFLRDLLGLSVSLGHVHDVLQAATRQASAVNAEPDLSGRGSKPGHT